MSPAATRQLRGIVLRLIYVNHQTQGERLNSTLIWAVVQREGYRFERDNILYVLQDLRDRNYVRYESMDDEERDREFIYQIEITADGRDLMDGHRKDPMVQRD